MLLPGLLSCYVGFLPVPGEDCSPIKGECHPYSEVLQLSLKVILMSNIVAPPCLRSTVLTQFSSAVSGWGCSRRSLWAIEPFLSFSQTFKLLLTRNRNTGALLCTMSSTTAWAKRSTRPPQVCWLTVSPILPTIRTASALGCSPTWTGTPLLRTPGDTLGKVSFVLPPCVCSSPLPLEATVIPVAKAKCPDAAVWSIFQIHIIWK